MFISFLLDLIETLNLLVTGNESLDYRNIVGCKNLYSNMACSLNCEMSHIICF